LPPELRGPGAPAYFRNRVAMQDRYLADIKSAFGDQVLAYVPELERDVTGLPMIERMAHLMYADGTKDGATS
jgi:arsenite-transporting ATPase